MTSFEAEVFDGGGAGFADPQPVQTEQHRRRGMIAVVLLGGEQEHAELGAVETAGVRRVHLRSADVLRRVRSDATRRCARSGTSRTPRNRQRLGTRSRAWLAETGMRHAGRAPPSGRRPTRALGLTGKDQPVRCGPSIS
jgi:hypothetical protein